MAERRIVEKTGQGIVCFISNYSWLDGLSFTGMRERYLEVFDRIWIDCLNGDKYKTGKLTPDGKPDPSVFSTEHNREGIQVGTADRPAGAARRTHQPAGEVRFRHLWGKDKRSRLLATLAEQRGRRAIEAVRPALELGLPFVPGECRRGLPVLAAAAGAVPRVLPGREDQPRRRSWWTSTASGWSRRMEQLLRSGREPTRRCARIAPTVMATTRALRCRKPRATVLRAARLPAEQRRPLLLPAIRSCAGSTGSRRPSCWTRSAPSTSAQVFEGNLWLVDASRTAKAIRPAVRHRSTCVA